MQDRVALVTGGSRGIGRATAFRLADMGAKIAVNYDKSPAEAAKVAETICGNKGKAFTVHADVADQEQVDSMVKEVLNTWGKIDILVNNAGIINDSLLLGMSVEAWDRVVSVNLRGTFLCTRAVVRGMLRHKWGRIVNIGSVVGIRGNAGQTNYAASKAGVIGFTKALAKEVATKNITVNAVTPGYISTDVVDVLPQSLKDKILTRIPQGRFGVAQDVAHLVAFLASEEANYITGQIISIDGGMAI